MVQKGLIVPDAIRRKGHTTILPVQRRGVLCVVDRQLAVPATLILKMLKETILWSA
jgi:hypothetical protein